MIRPNPKERLSVRGVVLERVDLEAAVVQISVGHLGLDASTEGVKATGAYA